MFLFVITNFLIIIFHTLTKIFLYAYAYVPQTDTDFKIRKIF